MNLNEYEWSRNPRGMHEYVPNHQIWEEWGLGWLKFVALDDQHVQWVEFALAKNITPIVRVHRPSLAGKPADTDMLNLFETYLATGCKWFEFYNEPNIPFEWGPGVDISPTREFIEPVCENWLGWAEWLIERGGYPGLMSLVSTGEPWGNTALWTRAIAEYYFDNQYERFRNVINNGMYLAVHPNMVNHWYQEQPGAGVLSARQAADLNYAEGGWHYEYPYDPIQQADDPGRTVWGGTPTAPIDDVHGLLGPGIAWLEVLQEMFGVGWLPVVGTEGGIYPIPLPDETITIDGRYPGYTLDSMAHGTIAMFEWLVRQAPAWMFGVCLWEIKLYWRENNPIPALRMMSQVPPLVRQNIPAYPALGDAPPPFDPQYLVENPNNQVVVQQQQNQPQADIVIQGDQAATSPPPEPTLFPTATAIPTIAGPGVMHGAPGYHFIYFAPDTDANWVFDSPALQDYWARHKPVLITDIEMIDFLTADDSLAMTLITTPQMSDLLQSQITTRWQNAVLDVIVVPDAATLETIFTRRNQAGIRIP